MSHPLWHYSEAPQRGMVTFMCWYGHIYVLVWSHLCAGMVAFMCWYGWSHLCAGMVGHIYVLVWSHLCAGMVTFMCWYGHIYMLVWSHLCAGTWCEKSSVRKLSRVMCIEGDLPRHKTLIRIWMRHILPPTNPMLKWTVLRARKSTGWFYCNSTVPWHQKHLPFNLVISSLMSKRYLHKIHSRLAIHLLQGKKVLHNQNTTNISLSPQLTKLTGAISFVKGNVVNRYCATGPVRTPHPLKHHLKPTDRHCHSPCTYTKSCENTNLMQHCAGFISAGSLYMFRAQAPIIRSI